MFRYLHAILLLLILVPLEAQDRFPFRELRKRDGLSQNSVVGIAQDGKGFMWFGTRDGLNRYDGDEFRVYRQERDDEHSLVYNDIRTLYFDADYNHLWVGTTEGLCRYREATDDFVAYRDDPEFGDRYVHFVRRDRAGRLLVGTDRGIFRHDAQGDAFVRIDGLPLQAYRVLVQDSAGTTFVGTPRGVFRLQLDADARVGSLTPIPAGDLPSGEELYVQDLLPEAGGYLWIATRHRGLFRLHLPSATTVRYATDAPRPFRISDDNVRVIERGSDGTLWAGTFVGLTRLIPDGQSYAVDARSTARLSGLRNHSIHALYRDARGTLWLGSYFGGVAFYDSRLEGIRHYAREGTGLRSSVVSAFAETPEGDLWVGTEGGGLHYYDRSADTLYPVPTREGLQSNNIKTLLLDGDRLWIGSYQGQLVYLDTRNGAIVNDWPYAPDSVRRSLTNVYDLALRNDTLWVANYGLGLTLVDLSGGPARTLRDANSTDSTLLSTEIRDIFLDRRGDIWLAGQDGLSRMRVRKGKLQFSHLLPDRVVYTVAEDEAGQIWAGTYGQGLYLIDPDSGTASHYEDEEMLAERTIYGMVRDSAGRLWISSSHGVAGQDAVSGRFRNYETPYNLQEQEYRISAAHLSRYNELVFGGTQGMTVFDLGRLSAAEELPALVFTKLQVANQEVAIQPRGGLLQRNIDETEQLTLPYDNANFSLSFAPLDFLARDRYRYAYRLDGLEEDWVNSRGRTTVSYTLQNAGDYRFRVRVSDGASEPYVERTLAIRVLPPPWKSWYAYLAYLILAGIVIAAASRYALLRHRLREEERDKAQQEALHQAKLRFFTNITHELRTPLTLMVGPLESVRRSGEVNGETARRLLTVEKNSRRLLQLVNELLTFRKFNGESDPLQLDGHDIVAFCQDIVDAFQGYAATTGKTLRFHSEVDRQGVSFDREKLEKVLYNLLGNAFKFTEAGGTIKLRLRREGTKVHLEVSDDGEGIPTDLHAQIFARFFERTSLTKREGTGIGLAVAREYVEMHGGEIDVRSSPGAGSTFHFWIPLRPPLSSWFEPSAATVSHELPAGIRETQKRLRTAREPTGPPPLILVVEDNEEVRDYIESILVGEYRILTAADGREGLARVREHAPDLVLSDVMMPVMDGIQLCATLKQDLETSHIPVMLLTAKSTDLQKLEGLHTGANDYVTKPFSPQELLLRIRNLLDSLRSARARTGRTLRLEPEEVQVTSADAEFLERAIAAVQRHMDDVDYRVDDFARDLAVSRALLFTKMKAITGHTPNNFMKLLRLKRAAQLLTSGELLVSEVAARVGYKDVRYFSSCFSKEYGCNPSAYGCQEIR